MEISQFVSLIIGLTEIPPPPSLSKGHGEAVGGKDFLPEPQQTVSQLTKEGQKRVTSRRWKIIRQSPHFFGVVHRPCKKIRAHCHCQEINGGANEGTDRIRLLEHWVKFRGTKRP